MQKNVKQQLALRVLSTAALVAMVSSIATAAFADTYDLNTGSVTVETRANGKKVLPYDYDRMLRVIASVEERGLDGEQAQIEAFYTVQKNK